jgi:hypothetical protein
MDAIVSVMDIDTEEVDVDDVKDGDIVVLEVEANEFDAWWSKHAWSLNARGVQVSDDDCRDVLD